ncbi:cell wall-binding repeat-containing protein [Mediannikoviicoccus vaginalis]|uniref:cell wall-binding repeat-containing protein n=1 Tax=Mediannikoviicoccus vaginalis TaxID=2899727 RepID=UPI001F33432D|nr:cell wall-binding repeat-containing protein [Mediannikoviicoccus vaginalis]
MNKKILAVLLAGAMLIPTGKTKASEVLKVERVYGSNRYETAVKLIDKYGKEDEIIIASGENFADALAVGPLAYDKDLPILLVRQNDIPKATKDRLSKMNISEITIVGGESSVSNKVKNELKADNVKRVAGKTRTETALEIDKIREYPKTGKTIGLYNAYADADALAAGPLAGQRKTQLLPHVNAPSHYYNQKINYIFGGKTTVPSNLTDVTRFSGKTRYETSVEIAKEYVKDNAETKNLIIASGQNMADALTSITAAKELKAPILLVKQREIPEETKAFIKDFIAKSKGDAKIHIVGGNSSVGVEVVLQLNAIAKEVENGILLEEKAAKIKDYYNNKLDRDLINEEFLKLINDLRAKNNVEPLTISKVNKEGSIKRVQELAAAGINGPFHGKHHVRPDGSEYSTLFNDKIDGKSKFENLGVEWVDVYNSNKENKLLFSSGSEINEKSVAKSFFDAWYNSPKHKANMLGKGFKTVRLESYCGDLSKTYKGFSFISGTLMLDSMTEDELLNGPKKPEILSRAELEKAIKDAKAIDLTNKTDESKQALTDAITKAEKVLKESATQKEVEDVKVLLENAVKGLEEKPEVKPDEKENEKPTENKKPDENKTPTTPKTEP